LAKRPPPGKCVHCLKDPVERDWDHVFPESWYPASTPPNTEKWKIPSCIPCNEKYGKLESDFRDRMGLCLDPRNPASESVVLEALRSMDVKAGRDPRDAQRRLQRAKKILSQLLTSASIPQDSVFPGMKLHEHVPDEDRVGMPIPADYFGRIAAKIVRGIFYIEDRKFIEPPYVIDFHTFVLNNEVTAQFEAWLAQHGIIYAREPGLVVHRAVTPDDALTSLFKITFWEQLSMYATVTRE
jgi:hypothetical protein